MNPKLIIASIAGVSALGGGIAGGYYYFKTDTSNSEKQTNNTRTTDSLESTTPKSQEDSVQEGLNPEKANPDPASTLAKGAVKPSPSPQGGTDGDARASSTGTEGVAATGVPAPRAEDGRVSS